MGLSSSQQSQLESIAIDFVFAAYEKFMAARQRAVNAGIDPATLDAAMKVADAQLQTVYPDPLAHPAPAPTPPDPTTVEYDTLAEGIAATTVTYPLVIQKADGKFCVWPNIGPFPGTKVYPT